MSLDLRTSSAQGIFLNELNTKFAAYVGGYGSGKTFVGCLDLLIFAGQNPKVAQGYFESALRRLYFGLMPDIRKFLYDPINDGFKASYQEAVEEFNLKIIAKRAEYESFDDVFNYLLDMLINRSGILRSNKRLTRAMLYYMYWNCDIGRDRDDQAI